MPNSSFEDFLPQAQLREDAFANRMAAAVNIRNYNHADYTHELIMDEVRAFESGLDNNHEVGVKLAAFGQSITLSVTDIGYANPSTLYFYGFVGDQKATLIQHVSQLNFLLVAVPKADPEKPARRIGFSPSSED